MDFAGDNQLVTVAEFESRAELNVARGLLESEGIECLAPEEYGRTKAGLSGVRLRLQVRAADAERAQALLVPVDDFETTIEEDE